MRIRCDYCGEVLFDQPLVALDHKSLRQIGPVADKDAHITTYHRDGVLFYEIRDDTGYGLGAGRHHCDEMTQ